MQATTPTDSRKKTTRGWSKSSARRGLQLLGALICIQVTCMLLSRFSAFLELAAHFSFHSLVAGAILTPVLFLIRRFWTAAATGTSTAILLMVVAPWQLYVNSSKPVGDTSDAAAYESRIKVLSWNVLTINRVYEEVQAIVDELDPDVIVFIEVRPGFLEALPKVRATYPIFESMPVWGGEGIAMLSRIEGTELEFQGFSFDRQPAIEARIPGGSGNQLHLVGIHTLSPLPPRRAMIRDGQLESLSDWSQDLNDPLCVCGDLNITPWTKAFQGLLADGFRDSRRGRGNCPSWPSELGPLGIPIDHVLTKGDCQILERRVIPKAPGSDHRPVYFEVAY